ncbi:hypothetical protein CALCODRAFT_484636 [Calocera cornea HHB12733]|uniref:Uncharacterized protein n=1 Tax=Calocera cornea HHB12733 TaxID=1353952 RepID=A0A165EW80_9BASI|nr:hypothetical protein CALCODRAFT_484636 [Calocera cornea HHB12733]
MAPDNPVTLDSGCSSHLLCSRSVFTDDTSNRAVAPLWGDERNHSGGPGSDPGPGIGVPISHDRRPFQEVPAPITTETENMFALLNRLEADPRALKDLLASQPIPVAAQSPELVPSVKNHLVNKSESKDVGLLPLYTFWGAPPPYVPVDPPKSHISSLHDKHAPGLAVSTSAPSDIDNAGYFRRRYKEGYHRGVNLRKEYNEIGLQTSNQWIIGFAKVWYLLTGGYTPIVDDDDFNS